MKQESKPSSFISKFHSILKNKSYETIMKFDELKAKIYIFDKEKLELQILPYFFRHNKFSSFIRQLNLYGFKKLKNTPVLCFTHPNLQNGQKFLTIIAKKKLIRESEEQEEDLQISHQQQINQGPHYNRLISTNDSLNSIKKPEIALSTPLSIYPMMGTPQIQNSSPLPIWCNWNSQNNGLMTVFMPMSGFYSGNSFNNYFQPYQA